MEIIERKLGYTNKMMYNQCLILQGIINKTIDIKVGRGKKSVIKKQLCYDLPTDVVDRINTSVNYYKQQMENKKSQITLRDYQNEIALNALSILTLNDFVYLAMEVRTGKTLTSLSIGELLRSNNVLFLTKKKAISSIQGDYDLLAPNYDITVINYESIHKIESEKPFDLIILDEAHGMGAFPKPSKRAKQVKELMIKNKYPKTILLSGTPSPESYSQMYHQVYGIPNNPFKKYKNFYRFYAIMSHI